MLDGIGKTFGTRRVLADISDTIRGGECVAVVGANGSGKSTLLKIVAGLLRPSRGTVSARFGGRVITDAGERRGLVGYCAPDLTFYAELSGAENLRFFVEAGGGVVSAGEIGARLDAVGLSGRGADRVSVYSSGMRQRLRLAFAVGGGDVPILLLDEPSLALDSGGVELAREIIRCQKERGGITLLATNDTREIAWSDRCIGVEARP